MFPTKPLKEYKVFVDTEVMDIDELDALLWHSLFNWFKRNGRQYVEGIFPDELKPSLWGFFLPHTEGEVNNWMAVYEIDQSSKKEPKMPKQLVAIDKRQGFLNGWTRLK